MTKKTKTQALAFALRLAITAESGDQSANALRIAKLLAGEMTAKQVAKAKQMAAIT